MAFFLPTYLQLKYLYIKKESSKRSSKKWTKTFFRDYLPCIANFFAAALNIFSKNQATQNAENMF